jgi:hypothetical protein
VTSLRELLGAGQVTQQHQRTLDPTLKEHLATLLALTPAELASLVPVDPTCLRSAWRLVSCLNTFGFQLGQAGRFEEALRLYDAATLCPNHFDLMLYQNALWAVCDDNHHLGVMRERGLRYLERCLPWGPAHPAIFYNAACLCFELGDREGAIAHVRDAVRWGYARLDLVEQEPMLAPLRADPRFLGAFSDSTLLAERAEWVMPTALTDLLALDGDYGELEFEMFARFEEPQETAEWLRLWSGEATVPSARLRVFAQDFTGGKVALWRSATERPLAEDPVVFFGSEGACGVVAKDLADFFVLFAGGVGPMEVVEQGVQELSGDVLPLSKVKALVATHFPLAAERTVPQALADAKRAGADFRAAFPED